MNDDERRRFSIGDGLILIAGLAAGMGLVRLTNPDLSPGQLTQAILHPGGGWSPRHAFEIAVELGTLLLCPFVAACTPACLLVQLPRTRRRRLRRQSGFVACLIATAVVTMVLTVGPLCIWLSIWDVDASSRYVKANLLGELFTGSAVLGAWASMGICGASRPSPTWRDRLGRLTGAIWVALGALGAAFIWLSL